jgi:hypothetical protein
MALPPLLVRCLPLEWSAGDARCLLQAAGELDAWRTIPATAEMHGLAPLLDARLREAGVQPPPKAARALRALSLRHRHANTVRTRALIEVLEVLEDASIPCAVLKGGALCHLLYPEPGLRPMRDLDLMVETGSVIAAREAIARLEGYLPGPPGETAEHHLTCGLARDHLRVTLEIHPGLSITEAVFPFSLGPEGAMAYTLPPRRMLVALCRHLARHTNLFEPLRLIWVADVIAFATRFSDQVDWERVGREAPDVLGVLSLLHALVELPEGVAREAGIADGHPVRGVGEDFDGWPRASVAAQRRRGKPLFRILRDTLFPSPWWLRLHHALPVGEGLSRYRWLVHPQEILACVRRLRRERTRK